MWHILKIIEFHSEFSWGSLRGKRILEDLAVAGKLILKQILKQWNGGVEWIDMAVICNRLL
jgi:hypothetical protein